MIQHSYKQSDLDLPDLSVQELLKLTHYIDVQKITTTCLLTIADSGLNLRQSSKFYIQRRKDMSSISKSQLYKAKPWQFGKEPPAAKSSVSKHTFDKHVSQMAKEEQIPSMGKIEEARSNEESSKSEGVVKSKRQKVEKIPSKKSSEPQKASCQSLKEFQKDSLQQFQDHLSRKTAEKIMLSEFMQTNKSKAIGDVSPKGSGSRPSKTQKCVEKSNPIEATLQPEQIHQASVSQQQPHKEESKENKEGQQPMSSNIKNPKSALRVTPQKQANRSKGKSKTKTPKQSSFYKPPIKIKGSDIYGPEKLQATPSQAIFLDYSAKDNISRPHQKKTIKQTNIFKKKINIKCEERVPVQLLPSSPESQSPNYKESQVQEKYHEPDYSQYHSYIIPQASQCPFSDEKDQIPPEKSYMDFYAIDISPCKAKRSNQDNSQMEVIEIPSSLASKPETQKIVPSPQSQAVSKPSKSSRKKIFEVLPSKPPEPPSTVSDLQSNSLDQQQLRLLLGVKGNKYKQAIVMQYIKETRRCKVK